MRSEQSGTIRDGVDLNVPPVKTRPPADVLTGFFERVSEDRQREIEAGLEPSGKIYSASEIAERVRLIRSADATTPMIRAFPDQGGLVFTRKRADGLAIQHRGGLVEFHNQPGWDYDHRVRIEVQAQPEPHLHTMAAFPIARPGGPPVRVATSSNGLGQIIRQAIEALSRVVDAGGNAVGGGEVVLGYEVLGSSMDQEGRRGRRTSSEVDREAKRVADLYQEYDKRQPGDRSRARWIAQQMGWSAPNDGSSDTSGARLVRKRLMRAADLGYGVPPASSTSRNP